MTWAQLVEARPDLAAAGEKLLCQFGVRLAFLATVRSDGGPRLYPIAPLLADGGLFAFLERSSKRGDLHNDGRYALHTFPCPDNEDAFYLSGRAELPTDVFREGSLRSEYMAEREWESPPPGFDEQQGLRTLHRALYAHGNEGLRRPGAEADHLVSGEPHLTQPSSGESARWALGPELRRRCCGQHEHRRRAHTRGSPSRRLGAVEASRFRERAVIRRWGRRVHWNRRSRAARRWRRCAHHSLVDGL